MVKRGESKTPKALPSGWGTDNFPWPPRNLPQWIAYAKAKPDPTWLLPGLLPYDAAVLVSGGAKVAHKTFLAFYIAIACATGKAVIPMFRPTEEVNVLVIELEGPEKQTASRWEKLLSTFGNVAPDNLYYMHRYPFLLDDEEQLKHVSNFIKEKGIKLVILDTLAKSHSGDENSTKEVSAVMRKIDVLRHAMSGGSVMFLHHLRKPSDMRSQTDIDHEIRGSSALSGYYDVHWAVRQIEGSEWLALTARQSDAEEKQWQIRWNISEDLGLAEPVVRSMNPEDVDELMTQDKLGLMVTDDSYDLKRLANTWEVPMEMAKAIAGMLETNGSLSRNGKKWRRIQ